MPKKTKVTALLPAYQSAEFIQRTLDSLSSQKRDNFDVIISVDLCDDDTYRICQDHCSRDSRFRLFKQTQRLGYVGNCNFLLEQADADYVLFAFHDDVLAPDYIDKLCEVLDSRPEVIMSFSDLLLTSVEGNQEHFAFKEIDGIRDRVQRGKIMLNYRGNWWIPNRGIFRLHKALKINGVKSHSAGDFAADWPWLFHMSLIGEFVRVPETLCFKIFQPNSLTVIWAFSKKQRYGVHVACMRELWSSELSKMEKIRLSIPLLRKLIKFGIKSLRKKHQAIYTTASNKSNSM